MKYVLQPPDEPTKKEKKKKKKKVETEEAAETGESATEAVNDLKRVAVYCFYDKQLGSINT